MFSSGSAGPVAGAGGGGGEKDICQLDYTILGEGEHEVAYLDNLMCYGKIKGFQYASYLIINKLMEILQASGIKYIYLRVAANMSPSRRMNFYRLYEFYRSIGFYCLPIIYTPEEEEEDSIEKIYNDSKSAPDFLAPNPFRLPSRESNVSILHERYQLECGKMIGSVDEIKALLDEKIKNDLNKEKELNKDNNSLNKNAEKFVSNLLDENKNAEKSVSNLLDENKSKMILDLFKYEIIKPEDDKAGKIIVSEGEEEKITLLYSIIGEGSKQIAYLNGISRQAGVDSMYFTKLAYLAIHKLMEVLEREKVYYIYLLVAAHEENFYKLYDYYRSMGFYCLLDNYYNSNKSENINVQEIYQMHKEADDFLETVKNRKQQYINRQMSQSNISKLRKEYFKNCGKMIGKVSEIKANLQIKINEIAKQMAKIFFPSI